MLNIFPELLDFKLLAPLILRFVLAFTVINLGISKLRSEKPRWISSFETLKLRPAKVLVFLFGITQVAGSILLFAGAYTQVVAIVFSFVLLAEVIIESIAEEILKRNFIFYLLLLGISLSLIFSGAGWFAFDFPL